MSELSIPVHFIKNILEVQPWQTSADMRREALARDPNLGVVFLKPVKLITNEILEKVGCPSQYRRSDLPWGAYVQEDFIPQNESAVFSALISFMRSLGIYLQDIEEKELSFETVTGFYPPKFTEIPAHAVLLKQYLYSGLWRMLVFERGYASSASFLQELNLIKGSVTNTKGDPHIQLLQTTLSQNKDIKSIRAFLADRTVKGGYAYDGWTDGFEIRNSAIHIPDDIQEQEHIMRVWDNA